MAAAWLADLALSWAVVDDETGSGSGSAATFSPGKHDNNRLASPTVRPVVLVVRVFLRHLLR
eukprot:COSAG05_NODE_29_length_29038_cov_1237.466985_14_plen_62_part_00